MAPHLLASAGNSWSALVPAPCTLRESILEENVHTPSENNSACSGVDVDLLEMIDMEAFPMLDMIIPSLETVFNEGEDAITTENTNNVQNNLFGGGDCSPRNVLKIVDQRQRKEKRKLQVREASRRCRQKQKVYHFINSRGN